MSLIFIIQIGWCGETAAIATSLPVHVSLLLGDWLLLLQHLQLPVPLINGASNLSCLAPFGQPASC